MEVMRERPPVWSYEMLWQRRAEQWRKVGYWQIGSDPRDRDAAEVVDSTTKSVEWCLMKREDAR
jgi:hypothetical protein